MQELKFHIIIPLYNCFRWLPRCFNSIASQRYRNFEVTVVDDCSTEEGQWEWTRQWCRHLGWRCERLDQNRGTLFGLVRATELADPADDDVMVQVDGDDWLAHDDVLGYLAKVYEGGDIDLTYGQFCVASNGQTGFCLPYDPLIIEGSDYRNSRVCWSHLRTYKAFLWKAIRDKDLRSPGGSYFRYATDHAFMNPMLEMAGGRYKAIDEVLYVFNNCNELSHSQREPISHLATRGYIRCDMKPYERLER